MRSTIPDNIKNRANFFITEKIDFFFQKIVFSKTPQVLRKRSFNLHNDCHNTLWSLTKRYLRSAILVNTGQKLAKIVLHR